MKSLVVYDSQYGNTQRVAGAIAAELGKSGDVQLHASGDAAALDLSGVDLLVIGGPTQGHRARPSLTAVVDMITATMPDGLAVATFDTRLNWPVILSGSAARSIAKALRRKGARLVAKPESFIVLGREGPLAEGELERAAAWAETLAPVPSTPH